MIGIISDIHGNYPALQAVLAELDKRNCRTIISLGDVAGYYCMINECIEELRRRNIVNVLGNHDFYMTKGEKCGRSYTANLCLDYQRKVITLENMEWLKQSISDWRQGDIWAVHGGWKDPLDEYLTDFSFLDANCENTKLYISGHTHVQRMEKGSFATYINPGSVGQPRDHNPQAAYALLSDQGEIELAHVTYDIDEIVDKMRKADFPDRVSSCLYTGVKIGDNEK